MSQIMKGLVGQVRKLRLKNNREPAAGCQWLTPVILATQEAEMKRIMVQSHPWENSL
jgi:hypothetical protein